MTTTVRDAGVPLTADEQRLLWLHELDPDATDYHLRVLLRVRGRWDRAVLEASLDGLVRRHPVLASRFARSEAGDPYRDVLDGFTIPLEDLGAATDDDFEALMAHGLRPFDLFEEPPVRAATIETPDGRVLGLFLHHAIADGRSLAVLEHELATLYEAGLDGRPVDLGPVPSDSADLARSERTATADDVVAARLKHWGEALDGWEPVELPSDSPDVSQLDDGVAHPWELDRTTTERLETLASNHRCPLTAAVHAVFATWLYRHSGQGDLTVGLALDTRKGRDYQDAVGFFVRTVPVRVGVDEHTNFIDLMQQSSAKIRTGRKRWVSYDRILAAAGAGGGAAFADALVVHHGSRTEAASGPSSLERMTLPQPGTRFGVELNTIVVDGRLVGDLRFRRGLLSPDGAAAAARRWVRVIRACLQQPTEPLVTLAVDEPVRPRAGVPVDPQPPLLLDTLARTVAQFPDDIALVSGPTSWTFGELGETVADLARRIAETGVGPEDRVAVLLPRSAAQVVALLAVIAAGGVAVPVDVDEPLERRRLVLRGAGVRLVVTAPGIRVPADLPTLMLDADAQVRRAGASVDLTRLAAGIDRGDAAYVIHTSGSTGAPKGVVVEHDQLAHLAARLREDVTPRGAAPRRVALTAALTFDVAWQGLLALAEGHEVHVVPENVRRDAERYTAYLREQGIELLDVTPSHLRALVECGLLDESTPVRQVIVAGEAIPSPLWQRLADDAVDAHNFYGPTETTVYITRCRVEPGIAPRIGLPLQGTSAYVLDAALRPVPAGVRGELYLNGPQVARGYLGRPDLTAERFVADPFAGNGTRMYRTGDLAHWDADGMLVFDGRRDGQVKVRGFRVELAEIEAVLTSHPAIIHAVVRHHGDHERGSLVAYVTTTGPSVTTESMRSHAASRLPRHMVPDVVILDSLPLTSSGKLDERALPTPEPVGSADHGREPATPREAVVCRIFAETLGRESYGPDADFFDHGGHSLLLTQLLARIRAVLGVEARIRDIMDAPTPAGVVRSLHRTSARPVVEQRAPRARFPLSPDQRRLWFLARAEGPTSTYTIPIALRLVGELDVDAMRAAVADLVERHPALRTVFGESDGVPFQEVLDPTGDRQLPELGGVLSAEPGPGDAHRTATLLDELVHQPIDLTSDPAFRAHLLRAGHDEHVLLLLLHHVVGDGWSSGILRRDLATAYAARSAGRSPDLPPPQLTFADHVAWITELLETPDESGTTLAERQAAVWREQLAGLPTELDLPADHPRPAVPSGRAHVVDLEAPAGLQAALAAVARRHGVTATMIYQAAVATLLHRLGAGEDVPVGAVVNTRSDPRFETEVGFFVNTQVLRIDLTGRPTFAELLARVRHTALVAYDHHELPFDQVVELVNPPRALARHPLFTVMVLAQIDEQQDCEVGSLRVSLEPTRLAAAKFDLATTFLERRDDEGAGGLRVRIEAGADLFEEDTAAGIGRMLMRLLTSVAANPDGAVDLLPVLDDVQARDLIALGESQTEAASDGRGVAARFVDQAARRPDAPAVEHDRGTLTYAALDAWSNVVARTLLQHGVRREERVALLLPRSAALVAAELAVLKAEAVYVPLQPGDPDERLRAMVQRSSATVVLCDANTEDRARALADRVVVLDSAPPSPVPHGDRELPLGASGDDLAYVMFTSGTTGEPKGVAVTHDNIVALVTDQRWAGRAHERVLLHSPAAFDASTYELWVPLLRGGCVVVGPAEVTDPRVLAEQVDRHGLTAVWLTSGLFQLVAELAPGCLRGLVEVWTGGDVVPRDAVERVLAACPGLVVCNGYGPTETTTFAASHRMESDTDLASPLPIGRPLDGTRLRVLDAGLAPTVQGVPGDLYIAGTGVARGYLDRPALTAERFVADPYGPPGARMYRTGDRAAWDDRGRLIFLGRGDAQVKLRGFRIEPDEVAAAIRRLPDVGQCSVIVVGEAAARWLVAVVTPAEVDTESITRSLAEVLPAYMVPSSVVAAASIPLTRNGKVDRAALESALQASPALGGGDTGSAPWPTRTLCALFAELLGVEAVGPDDDFFQRGGNSLLVVRLISRVRAALGVDLTVQHVFENPTPRALGLLVNVDEPVAPSRPPLRPAPPSAPDVLAPHQLGLWYLQQLDGGLAAYNVPFAMRLAGTIDVDSLRGALRDLLLRHEPLRTLIVVNEGSPRPVVVDDEARLCGVLTVGTAPSDLGAAVDAEANRPFDLGQDLPVRVLLLPVAPEDHLLVLTLHHLAVDGWSLGILWRDLATAYEARRSDVAPAWAPLPVRYADYAAWQTLLLGPLEAPTAFAEAQLAFWGRTLAGLPDEIGLPYDRGRPASGLLTARTVDVSWDGDTLEALRELAAAEGATLQMVVQAAVAALLARGGAGDDIPIGTPAAGRADAALDDLVGYFVSMVVLRFRPTDGASFTNLLQHVRDTSLSAFAHQDLPFERVVQHLAPTRRLGRNPLFQTLVTCVRRWSEGLRIGEAKVSAEEADLNVAKFDLAFEFVETDTDLTCRLVYAVELFGPQTAQELADDLHAFVGELARRPDDVVVTVATREPRVAVSEGPAAPPTRVSASLLARAEVLRRLFAEVLGREDLGVDDDFFAAGGHSLAAVRVAVRAREVLGVDVAISHLLTGRTPAGTAALINDARAPRPYDELLTLRPSSGGPDVFAVHPVTGTAWSYLGLAAHLPAHVGLHGLQAVGLDPSGSQPPARSVREAARSAIERIRTVRPNGPYHLLGWSYGGVLAHAIATGLQTDGDEVASVVLLDGYPLHEIETPVASAAAAVREHLPGPAVEALRPDEWERIESITRNNLSLGAAHVPDLFEGNMLLVEADIATRPTGIGPHLWRPYVTGTINVVRVDHGHFELLDPEAQPTIAHIVAAHLEASQ